MNAARTSLNSSSLGGKGHKILSRNQVLKEVSALQNAKVPRTSQQKTSGTSVAPAIPVLSTPEGFKPSNADLLQTGKDSSGKRVAKGVNHVPPPGFFPYGLFFPLDHSKPVFRASRTKTGSRAENNQCRKTYKRLPTHSQHEWALHSWDAEDPEEGVLPKCPYRMKENGKVIMAPELLNHLKQFGYEFLRCSAPKDKKF